MRSLKFIRLWRNWYTTDELARFLGVGIKKDRKIAKKIKETLARGFAGLLFMGKARKVVEKLNPCEFEIINLLEAQ